MHIIEVMFSLSKITGSFGHSPDNPEMECFCPEACSELNLTSQSPQNEHHTCCPTTWLGREEPVSGICTVPYTHLLCTGQPHTGQSAPLQEVGSRHRQRVEAGPA